MPDLPSATTRTSDESGGLATGTELCFVWAPVKTLADNTPRIYYSAQAAYDAHGYAPGIDYGALHVQETGYPFCLVPLPITTQGTVGRIDTSGNTDTCVVSIATAAGGALEETDGELKVVNGGTIGTDQILFDLTLDGGRTWQPLRLGTANSKTIPYVGLVLSFAAGDLTAGETVITWHSTAPLAGATDIAAAKTKLAAQMRLGRRWLLVGDLSLDTGVSAAFKTAVDGYETGNERYVLAKAQLRDRQPQATMSKTTVRMSGTPTVTFANSGDADTITRNDAGSFITDGFVAGDLITVTGAAVGGNNITAKAVANVAASVLTFGSDTTLTNEGPKAGCTLTGTPSITFAEAGAADTITRSRGSWFDDGFRDGDIVTIADSVSNDLTTTVGVTITSATVMTLGDVADDLAAEVIGESTVTITAGETDAAAVAALDTEFAAVTSDERYDLGYGRGAMTSPITGWQFRRPVQWADMLLSFQRDIRTTTWWKDLGPIHSRLSCGFDLNDANGNPYEHDERTDGGALAARFTCARTWGNGPVGAFIAQSLTRADDGSILGMSHNVDIANLAQTIVQSTTENFAGSTLVLEPADNAGKRVATAASLKAFEEKVNSELERYLLSNIGGEGQRASVAKWTAAVDDDLGVSDATLHGSLDLQLNGTLVHISTTVTVR
jgi:hypothetical protein